jgi:hypothetical protein
MSLTDPHRGKPAEFTRAYGRVATGILREVSEHVLGLRAVEALPAIKPCRRHPLAFLVPKLLTERVLEV